MIKPMNGIIRIDYKKLTPALGVAETIHNAEEAVWLPAWSQTAGLKEGIFDAKTIVIGAIGFAAVIGPLLPALFAVGAFVERFT